MNSPSKNESRNSRGSLSLPTSSSAQNTISSHSANQTTSTRITVPSSPTSSYFPSQAMHSQPGQSSSTHAGGIQPSSSFFRPARPAQQAQFSHPPIFDTGEASNAKDQYPLSTLNHSTAEQNRSSLGHSSNEDPVTDTTEEQHTTPRSPKRFKQSREPLIPASGSVLAHRTSLSAASPSTPSSSPKKPTSGGRTRTSLDKVFGLSFPTRISFDSMRHRNNNPLVDEERADRPHAFTKFPRQNTPESPTARSFNVHPVLEPPSPSRSLAPSRTSGVSPARSTPTPPPFFIATAPTPTPESRYPLSHTPLLKPDSSRFLRKHALHPSRNRFFLSGRLLTGGDTPYAFLSTLTFVFALSGVWLGTTCVFWWHYSSGGKAIVIIGAYLTALVISTMLTTATTDPGILPRGLDPNPPYPATSPSDGGVRVPMPRDLRVRSDIVRVKYCPTCKTYRPPRSSHCKMCDNCVDGCDHHCQWVNNCIGRRNYTTFFTLLCAAATAVLLVIITSAIHLWLLTTEPTSLSFRRALGDNKGIGSAIAFCLGVAVIWPVSALLMYHVRLLLLNVTTIEMIRNQAHKTIGIPGTSKPTNPFSYGTKGRNFVSVFCRTPGFSWLDAHAVATEDLREVNPGMHGVGEHVRDRVD